MDKGTRTASTGGVGRPSGPGTSAGRVPDLHRAGEVLGALRAMWPFEDDTVFVGLGHGGTRAHVGFIRDRSRKAVRLSGPSFAVALENAACWTRNNPERIRFEAEDSAKGKGGTKA